MKKIIMCAISGLMLVSMAGASQPTVGTGEKSSPQPVPKAALQELISQTTDEEIKAWIQNPEAQLAKSLLLYEQATKWIIENAKITPTTASLDAIRNQLSNYSAPNHSPYYDQGAGQCRQWKEASGHYKQFMEREIKNTHYEYTFYVDVGYRASQYKNGVNSVAPDFPWNK